MDPAFFATPDEWHAWLAEHHETVPEGGDQTAAAGD
jgi:hypothetical protein